MPITPSRRLVGAVRKQVADLRARVRQSWQSLFGALDRPSPGQRVSGILHLEGWELHQGGDLARVEFVLDGQPLDLPLERFPRPDLADRYPALSSTNPRPGFKAALNTALHPEGPHLLQVRAQVGSHQTVLAELTLEFVCDEENAVFRRARLSRSDAERAQRLETILPLLACPHCQAELQPTMEEQLHCRGCQATYPVSGHVPILVREPEYPVDADLLDSPASNNYYPPVILRALEETLSQGGLALDVGSGRRSFGVPGLVQLEICTYPFTDVVSQSDFLPFRTGSFDLVFSLAVTEHVKRPWILAAELQRVLKPGGLLVVDSAFLQPLHGYPSHYYNMTHLALKDLFREMKQVSLEPAAYQHPWFSLSWILERLASGLPEKQRELIDNWSLGQLRQELQAFCQGRSSRLAEVRLPQQRIEELAAGFTLIARKAA